jgi:putative hydrolase of the HAD superfamily
MYKHIFFDLDHTLWDHHRNSKIALGEVFELFQLQEISIPSMEQFYHKFNEVNHKLWLDYEKVKFHRPNFVISVFVRFFSTRCQQS